MIFWQSSEQIACECRNPSSNTFCGPSVLSEPEDRAYGELLDALQETQPVLGAVDFHTCGSLLLWPWQYVLRGVDMPPEPITFPLCFGPVYDIHVPRSRYSYEQLPIEDRLEFEVLGLAQEVAINAVNDGAWRSIQGVDLYPHSGGFIDSVYEVHGIIGYTYEGSSILGGCHVQPAEAILPSSEEQWAGVLVSTQGNRPGSQPSAGMPSSDSLLAITGGCEVRAREGGQARRRHHAGVVGPAPGRPVYVCMGSVSVAGRHV